MALVPRIKDNDWVSVRQAITKLAGPKLGPKSTPIFADLTLTNLTASRLVYTDANKQLESVADLTSWVAGVANEIDITDDGDGTITVGIINPLIVAKGGTGTATLTDGGILLGSGTGAVTVLAQATNGQIPIGSTGADPVLAGLTGTSNQITITNAAGSITLSLPQDYDTSATPILGGLTIVNAITEFSIDDTLGGNSDSALPTEQAVKAYVDNAVAGSSLYAFKTITGITNDVVADATNDTLTLASANSKLTVVGTAATDTVTFTIVEGQIVHDNLSGFVAGEHLSLPNTIANVLSDHNLAAHTALGLFDTSSDVDHDATTNFAANEHFLQTAITNVSTALATGLLKVTTGTGALSVITDSSSNWDLAYTHIGESGASHTYIDQNVTTTGTPSFSTINSLTLAAAAVGFTIAGGTTPKTLTVDDNFVVSTQLAAIAANIAKVTESTTVTAPLVLTTYDISIPVATTSANGYLSSTDWNTFNSKQAGDAGLTSLAGLTYASDSFIKVTATDTYAIRTIAETKTDLSLNLVENTALSTWVGTTNITTLGTITTVGNITIADGGTIGQAAGPLLTFDDTNNYLEITGCKVSIGTATPVGVLSINTGVANADWIQLGTQSNTASRYIGVNNTAVFTENSGFHGIEFGPTSGTGAGYLKFHTHQPGHSSNVRFTISSTGYIGFWEEAPVTLFEFTHSEPFVTLHCNTETDADGGRRGQFIFRGEQSGGEESVLGAIAFSHDGAADDEKGKFLLTLNDGNDGISPSVVGMSINSAGNLGISQTTFGTNMTKGFAQSTGVAPTTSPADCFQMYSADIAAGHAACHIRNENDTVVKLYQQAHITDAPGDTTANNATTINAILTALENNGLLADA